MNRKKEKHEFTHSSKWISYLFVLLAVLPLLLIILMVFGFVPHLGGLSILDFWTNEENL